MYDTDTSSGQHQHHRLAKTHNTIRTPQTIGYYVSILFLEGGRLLATGQCSRDHKSDHNTSKIQVKRYVSTRFFSSATKFILAWNGIILAISEE